MKHIFNAKLLGLLTVAVVAIFPAGALAQSEPDFKGKTVRLIIGTSTGGGASLEYTFNAVGRYAFVGVGQRYMALSQNLAATRLSAPHEAQVIPLSYASGPATPRTQEALFFAP